MISEQLWNQIENLRKQKPLIHNITNYVVMNNTANALLAAGASPVMAHGHPELSDMVNIASAVVINIGTLDEYWVESYTIAAEAAGRLDKPWILDPVGAGATPYRNQVLQQLLHYRPTVIRGNASEIMALAQEGIVTKGVDSTNTSLSAVYAAQKLNSLYGSVICISGEVDVIVDKDHMVKLHNGHTWMSLVTGMGCTASALVGAFTALDPKQALTATVSAMAFLGVCGELAAEQSAGPGSLQMHLYDQLYHLSSATFADRLYLID